MGTSAASVKLQVRRELEAERKAAALAETYSPPKEVELDGALMLAVSGVYFRCPLVGPEVRYCTFCYWCREYVYPHAAFTTMENAVKCVSHVYHHGQHLPPTMQELSEFVSK